MRLSVQQWASAEASPPNIAYPTYEIHGENELSQAKAAALQLVMEDRICLYGWHRETNSGLDLDLHRQKESGNHILLTHGHMVQSRSL